MIVALASEDPNIVLDSYLARAGNTVRALRNPEVLRAIVMLRPGERQSQGKQKGVEDLEGDCPGYKLGRELGRGSFSVVFQGKRQHFASCSL